MTGGHPPPGPPPGALERLDKWLQGDRAHSVVIRHHNGYGSNPGWEVELWDATAGRSTPFTVLAMGVGVEEAPNVFSVRDHEDFEDDWPNLSEVIDLALEKAEELL